jgi:hypothetical protein
MLLQAILASHLVLAAGRGTGYATPPDEMPALPTAMSQERSAQFVSFVAPFPVVRVPQVTTHAATSPARQPSTQESLHAELKNQMYRSNGHIVKVTLTSHRTIVGKLVAVDNESFTLRSNQHSGRVKIRYTEVVGQPKIRPSANEVIGWGILVAGVIVAIPAMPFIFLGLAITGDIAD